ncbi:hypothetical protein TOC8171_14910 [Pseudomonas syringae]
MLKKKPDRDMVYSGHSEPADDGERRYRAVQKRAGHIDCQFGG